MFLTYFTGANTGDNTNIWLYVGGLLFAIVLLIILFVMKRKKDEENQE